jgi:hypothetical protein
MIAPRLRHHLRHWLRERVAFRLAWLLPRDVAMWATIRVGAHATQGKWGSTEVPALPLMEALKRWDDRS